MNHGALMILMKTILGLRSQSSVAKMNASVFVIQSLLQLPFLFNPKKIKTKVDEFPTVPNLIYLDSPLSSDIYIILFSFLVLQK